MSARGTDPGGKCLGEQVRAAFDAVAPLYDKAFGNAANAVMGWLRRENMALLAATFPPQSRLLELGCGTGEEAIFLARRGTSVLITDISPAMVRLARRKAFAAGVGDRVQALVLPAGGAAALRPKTPFDGVYASFGALNCEPDLEAWARAMADFVHPGGAVVCSVMNRLCLWEVVWFAVHGRWREARRRWPRGWHHATLSTARGTVTVPVRYLSAGDIERLLAPAFTVEQVMALPFLLPPPYLDGVYRRYRRLFRVLEQVERRWRERWPWRHLGDHVVVVARRRP